MAAVLVHFAMRQSTSRRSQPSKRQKTVQWTIVEPTLSPMLTPEQIAALNAAPDQAVHGGQLGFAIGSKL
ncbi:hypothetical protein [Xanthomonas oryzae]|uniref:hypothetical protein n=1 Tax=Xanthomonas oryzae TaxID=347 RepID=UPI0033907163